MAVPCWFSPVLSWATLRGSVRRSLEYVRKRRQLDGVLERTDHGGLRRPDPEARSPTALQGANVHIFAHETDIDGKSRDRAALRNVKG